MTIQPGGSAAGAQLPYPNLPQGVRAELAPETNDPADGYITADDLMSAFEQVFVAIKGAGAAVGIPTPTAAEVGFTLSVKAGTGAGGANNPVLIWSAPLKVPKAVSFVGTVPTPSDLDPLTLTSSGGDIYAVQNPSHLFIHIPAYSPPTGSQTLSRREWLDLGPTAGVPIPSYDPATKRGFALVVGPTGALEWQKTAGAVPTGGGAGMHLAMDALGQSMVWEYPVRADAQDVKGTPTMPARSGDLVVTPDSVWKAAAGKGPADMVAFIKDRIRQLGWTTPAGQSASGRFLGSINAVRADAVGTGSALPVGTQMADAYVWFNDMPAGDGGVINRREDAWVIDRELSGVPKTYLAVHATTSQEDDLRLGGNNEALIDHSANPVAMFTSRTAAAKSFDKPANAPRIGDYIFVTQPSGIMNAPALAADTLYIYSVESVGARAGWHEVPASRGQCNLQGSAWGADSVYKGGSYISFPYGAWSKVFDFDFPKQPINFRTRFALIPSGPHPDGTIYITTDDGHIHIWKGGGAGGFVDIAPPTQREILVVQHENASAPGAGDGLPLSNLGGASPYVLQDGDLAIVLDNGALYAYNAVKDPTDPAAAVTGWNQVSPMVVATQAALDAIVGTRDGAVAIVSADGMVRLWDATKRAWKLAVARIPNGKADGDTLRWDTTTNEWIIGSALPDGNAENEILSWSGTEWLSGPQRIIDSADLNEPTGDGFVSYDAAAGRFDVRAVGVDDLAGVDHTIDPAQDDLLRWDATRKVYTPRPDILGDEDNVVGKVDKGVPFYTAADDTFDVRVPLVADMGDVDTTKKPDPGDVLSWDAINNRWKAQTPSVPLVQATTVRPPVASVGALPATGNVAGDIRLTLDTNKFHMWNGTKWDDIGSVVGSVIKPFATKAAMMSSGDRNHGEIAVVREDGKIYVYDSTASGGTGAWVPSRLPWPMTDAENSGAAIKTGDVLTVGAQDPVAHTFDVVWSTPQVWTPDPNGSGVHDGQVLTVDSRMGATLPLKWADLPKALPASTNTDAKKVLTVDAGGNAVWTVPAPALPAGGTAGQVLAKKTATDGDAQWITMVAPQVVTRAQYTALTAAAKSTGVYIVVG